MGSREFAGWEGTGWEGKGMGTGNFSIFVTGNFSVSKWEAAGR